MLGFLGTCWAEPFAHGGALTQLAWWAHLPTPPVYYQVGAARMHSGAASQACKARCLLTQHPAAGAACSQACNLLLLAFPVVFGAYAYIRRRPGQLRGGDDVY